jgi:CheY-like chemotaxis protein/HPt (histidine-containing phosphotransfer) domain-containing protein
MARSESTNTPSNHFRILVVEDNPVNQKIALRQLRMLGYDADVAANGLEALEALEGNSYDAVLMDCQMPEMDGYEATRAIRLREGESRHTPVIAMTDNAVECNRERCYQSGMDDYINKPARQEDLAALLAHWTQSHSARPTETGAAAGERAPARVIDREVIDRFRRLTKETCPDLLPEIIDMFIKDSPARINKMKEALHRADAEALAQAAHSLKGSSGQVGARRMFALCDIIEERSRAGCVQGADTLVLTLEEEFGRVRLALEAEKKPVA